MYTIITSPGNTPQHYQVGTSSSMTAHTTITTAHVAAATVVPHVGAAIAAATKPCAQMVRGNGRQIDPGTSRSSMR